MKLIIKIIIVLLFWFFSICINNYGVMAALNSIDVDNNVDQSTVVLKFSSIPVYHSFSLHDPERLVIDIVYYTSMNTDIFPINFSGKNLIKRIRSSISTNRLNLRLVFDTDNQIFHVQNVLQRKDGDLYYLIFFFTKKVVVSVDKVKKLTYISDFRKKNLFIDNGKRIFDDGVIIVKKYIMLMLRKWDAKSFEPIVVAIDAGHGGQDPGAVGLNGLCEKNVTIAIAYKLKDKLDANKKFKTVLTRDGDYFLSVMGRSEVARKKGADVLVSIHTDASCNKNVRGASVWILSNRRANSEMGNWLLEEQDKRAELLGGIADLLTTSKYVNPYFDQAILDLQFCHSQRVGYELGMCILHYLRDVVTLHKIQPESSSLGVLRSPDIPSILVEIGFISNLFEEKLLNNKSYQEKIAMAIYKGLYSYFVSHPLYSSRITSNGIFHHCSY